MPKLIRRHNRRTVISETQQQVRERLADVIDFFTRRIRASAAHDSARTDAFLGALARAGFLLDEIQTRRAETQPTIFDRRVLAEARRDLDHIVTAIFTTYGELLSPLTFASEFEAWADQAAAAITSEDEIDSEFGAPELDGMRHQLETWRQLAAIDALPDMIQSVLTTQPGSEADLQDRLMGLMKGARIQVLPEYELAPTGFDRRRLDLFCPRVQTGIETKLCTSPRRRGEILEEVRADRILANDHRRLLFIIYDVCCIRDPRAYEQTLESFFDPSSNRSVCVRVVKH